MNSQSLTWLICNHHKALIVVNMTGLAKIDTLKYKTIKSSCPSLRLEPYIKMTSVKLMRVKKKGRIIKDHRVAWPLYEIPYNISQRLVDAQAAVLAFRTIGLVPPPP